MEEDKTLELRLAPPGNHDNSWSSPPIKRETSTNFSKRMELSAFVGWPPVRSYRRNQAGKSLSKPPFESAGKTPKNRDDPTNQLFVKINMEGVPIGRKVNLSACNSYEELSCAIDELFRGLLAAQTGCSADDDENGAKEETANKGGIGASGEYTLVYEDNEGDRILVGDVPWHMFISTVKRLHVLKIPETAPPNSATKTGK